MLREAVRIREVYPRVCGETGGALPSDDLQQGLSPRVRGNRPWSSRPLLRWRSIPACAGKPPVSGGGASALAVYPRVCGETVESRHSVSPLSGLSPRVRGNHRTSRRSVPEGRSIPACAGKPSACAAKRVVGKVYPRVCGETGEPMLSAGTTKGLSPRVRGNPRTGRRRRRAAGSIPACAGKPSATRRWRCGCRVYPRVCGETEREPCLTMIGRGLSPRVRGNLLTDGDRLRIEGSIPACAGKPTAVMCLMASSGVYPRVCGETA